MFRALVASMLLASPVLAQMQQAPAQPYGGQPGYQQPVYQQQPQYAPPMQQPAYAPPPQYAQQMQQVELSLDSPDPKVPHYPGIYMMDASGSEGMMRRIEAIQMNLGFKKGGGLVSGIASMAGSVAGSVNPLAGKVVGITGVGKSSAGKVITGDEVELPGGEAGVYTSGTSPVFYIFYDESIPPQARSASITPWLSAGGSLVSTPAQLRLIQFDGSKKKRQLPVGDEVKAKDQIPYSAQMLARGVYRVTLRNKLKPGQYGFVQEVVADDGSIGVRIFDFDILKTK